MAALEETGFLYLKNTGLTKEEVVWSNEVCERFFSRPKEEKEKFARSTELHRTWPILFFTTSRLISSFSYCTS